MARLTAPGLFRLARIMEGRLPGIAARLHAAAQRRMKSHDVLHDIEFTLMPGESIGIIGANGSGKSTLLQIIAGVLRPTSGEVEVHGRVAALLELGSGFNPELSGRENVRINAAVLGLTRTQVDERLPAIAEFADIGTYLDEPVKTYSSGMALRLAFAVQVHIDPEVLIVDEALAVGDAAFQAKAMDKIDQILQRGTTLLFVGHDLNAVKAFCQRAMLLDQGRIVLTGLPDEVITEYLYRTHQRTLAKRLGDAEKGLTRIADGYGFEDAHVVAATLNGATHVTVSHGQALELRLQVRLRPDITAPCLIVDIMDGRGLQLTGKRIALPSVEAVGDTTIAVGFDAVFQQGIYRIRLRLADSPSLGNTTIIARQEGGLSFEVTDDSRAMFTGIFPIDMQVAVG